MQALQLSDPGFKFGTRQQALRDRPWKDWQGVTFLPVRRSWSCWGRSWLSPTLHGGVEQDTAAARRVADGTLLLAA